MVLNPEDEYIITRKRLDALGYKQPLGIDTLPLVDVLLSDLVQTTSSLKKYKLKTLNTNNTLLSNKFDNLDTVVAPFKADNARLLRENNDLSNKIINLKDDFTAKIRNYKAQSRKLENENVDLIRLNDTYIKAAQDLERETKLKSNMIQKLQERSIQTVIEMPKDGGVRSGSKHSIRRQRFYLDSTLSPGTIPAMNNENYNPVSARDIDCMKLQDQRIAQLSNDLTTVRQELDSLNIERESFEEKLLLRDTEIARLRKELTGGRPEDVVTIEARCNASDRLIEQLNAQLELVQGANNDLEKVIEQERINFRKLNDANEDQIAELQAANLKIDKLTLELANAGQDKMIAKDYSSKLKEDTFSLEQKLVDLSGNNKRLQMLLDNLRKDNTVLAEQLRDTQKELSELVVNHPNRLQSPELTQLKLNKLLKTLEDDRDAYKNQVIKLQNIIQKSNKDSSGLVVEDAFTSKNNNNSQNNDEAHNFNTGELLKQINSSPMKKSDEFLTIVKQRDSLQIALERFEAHMSEIQTNVRILTKERDNALAETFNVRQELDLLRGQIVEGTGGQIPNETKVDLGKSVLKKVEEERDIAMENSRQSMNAKESLQARYASQEKRYIEEKANLTQEIEDLNNKLATAIEDRNLFETNLANTTTEKESLEIRVSQLENALQNSETHIEAMQSQLETLKNQLKKTENRVEEFRCLSDNLTAERDGLIIERKQRLHEMNEMNSKILKTEQLAKKSKANMLTLDREKDQMQTLVDDKTEQIYSLEKDLRKTELALRSAQENNDQAKSYTEKITEDVANYQREIQNLKRQQDVMQRDFDKELKSKEEHQRNAEGLRRDIVTMENDKKLRQMDIDTLNRTVVQHNTEISRLNEIIQSYKDKQQGDEDIIKSVKQRSDMIEEERQKTLKELAGLRETKIILESNCRALQNNVEIQTETNSAHMAEIQQHLKTISEFEQANQNLNSALSEAKAKATEFESNIKIANEDMEQCREINARLQNEIDQQFAAHNEFRRQNEKAIDEVDMIRSALDLANKELDEEKAHARELEMLVQKGRHREFEMQLETSQMKDELVHQKDKATHADDQIKIRVFFILK